MTAFFRPPVWWCLTSLLVTLPAQAEPAAPIAPFSAEYALSGSNIPFNIKARRTLRAADDGQWYMEVRASNLIGEIRETTQFRWNGCDTPSERYSYHRRGLGRVRDGSVVLDHDAHIARTQRTGKDDSSFPIPAGATDVLAQTLALQCELMRGTRSELGYQVANERRLETMRYRVVGNESVKTGKGRVEAVKLERIRSGDSERNTLLWFAPSLDYALVKMIQQDGNDEYSLVLQTP